MKNGNTHSVSHLWGPEDVFRSPIVECTSTVHSTARNVPHSGGGTSPWSLATTLWNNRDIITSAGSFLYNWFNSDSPTSAPSPATATAHHPAPTSTRPPSASAPASTPTPISTSTTHNNPVHMIEQAIASLASVTNAAPVIVILSSAISKLNESQTMEASALIANAISQLANTPNTGPAIASLATVIANLANPGGLLSANLPSLGMTYQSKQINLVLTSMLITAKISEVKVMSPVKIILESENSNLLDGISKELFNAKALILPVELSSTQGSHWVFLIIDSQFGTVKLLDTENDNEAAVKSFLSHSPLSTWQFSIINIDHQQYSDSCGVEGVSQLIAYLKNTTAIDPASAAVIQSMTYLDYLVGTLESIFTAEQFYQLKNFLIEQVNKAINFALDTNNQALVLDLLNQADSVQTMCPLSLGGHPFKPDPDDPDGNFNGGGANQQNWPVQDKNSIGIVVNINGTIYDKEGRYE